MNHVVIIREAADAAPYSPAEHRNHNEL
jgi:hypothetical protein